MCFVGLDRKTRQSSQSSLDRRQQSGVADPFSLGGSRSSQTTIQSSTLSHAAPGARSLSADILQSGQQQQQLYQQQQLQQQQQQQQQPIHGVTHIDEWKTTSLGLRSTNNDSASSNSSHLLRG